MAGMSKRKATKARRLVTGAGLVKDARGIAVPRSSGKPLSKREEKKVATNRLKNAASQMARSTSYEQGPTFNDTNRRANKKLAAAQVKAVETGVSAKRSAKAVSKGFKVVAKRVKTDAKAAAKTDKKYVSMSKAQSKGKQALNKVKKANDPFNF